MGTKIFSKILSLTEDGENSGHAVCNHIPQIQFILQSCRACDLEQPSNEVNKKERWSKLRRLTLF